MQDYEKLGSFYLGKVYDLASRTRRDDLLLYDSKDLVTHAVCVGMTGSGKTGLCLGLLEEAAIDGIPAIVIDPKGDLANLLLTFPNLAPADFAPWINPDDAKRKGMTPEQFAKAQADLWAKGLADWGQSGERIQRLKDAADFAVYTPGSSAGIPVSVLKSLAPPSGPAADDAELLRERISTTVTSILGLLKIDADPIKSREHILLSSLIARAWDAGQTLDLPALIDQLQKPPFDRVGVMPLDSFFPAKDRFELAMALNNLLASPGFQAWTEGQPLDIAEILYTPSGKPRVAIFSIAHLPDAERMFFVAMLLSSVLAWTRAQSGTTSLRAIVYMDEIAGYFPPTANPPSKQPLLTLMKQARAFGVGVVLATQNPVDLDYKGLANAGTWFIGRLQTDRDKQRVLDGLEGAAAHASAAFDRAAADKALSSLAQRVFLMNNVHEDAPVIMETRWCLSYLRGPLTRQQIKTLMDPRRAEFSSPAAAPSPAAPAAPAPTTKPTAAATPSTRPVLPPEIPQYFLPVRSAKPAGASLVYRPALMGAAKLFYQDAKLKLDTSADSAMLVPIRSGPVPVDFEAAAAVNLNESDLSAEPTVPGSFDALPPEAAKPKNFDAWKKQFIDTLARLAKLELVRSPALAEVSSPGESERDFRVRLSQVARERRDAEADKLRVKYAAKTATLQDRLRRAEAAEERQKAQSTQAKVSAALSFGAAILGAFTGRKTLSAGNVSRGASALRNVGRTVQESRDVGLAADTVEALQQQLADLEAQFQADLDALAARIDPATETFERLTVRPKKTGINVKAVVLAWTPYWTLPGSDAIPAWD
jgi:hypothetical protein